MPWEISNPCHRCHPWSFLPRITILKKRVIRRFRRLTQIQESTGHAKAQADRALAFVREHFRQEDFRQQNRTIVSGGLIFFCAMFLSPISCQYLTHALGLSVPSVSSVVPFCPLAFLFSCFSSISWFPEPPAPHSEFRTPPSFIIPREQSLREEQSDENDPLLRFLGHFVSRKRAFFPENARTTVQAPRRLEA